MKGSYFDHELNQVNTELSDSLVESSGNPAKVRREATLTKNRRSCRGESDSMLKGPKPRRATQDSNRENFDVPQNGRPRPPIRSSRKRSEPTRSRGSRRRGRGEVPWLTSPVLRRRQRGCGGRRCGGSAGWSTARASRPCTAPTTCLPLLPLLLSLPRRDLSGPGLSRLRPLELA